jgi:iron complex transport system substrate-binding protein
MYPKKLLALLAALMLMAAACGSDSDDDAAAVATTAAPADESDAESADDETAELPEASTDDADTEFVSAIISLSPTATEMLYAIGAEDQILAVDSLSNFPAEAAEKMQGLSAFEPNVEAIAALEPDLVVTDGTNPDLLGQLDSLGIPHWEGTAAADFDDIHTQIEQLGAVTGKVGEAAEVVSDMTARVDAVTSSLATPEVPLTYYHELDPTFYSVSPATFIGSIYTLVGLESIVAGDSGLYPQLSQEFIVDADPDLIFLACTIYCGETAESVAARDGWGDLAAVQSGAVIEMNDDIASRWGPRSVDYLEQVAAAVASLAPAS